MFQPQGGECTRPKEPNVVHAAAAGSAGGLLRQMGTDGPGLMGHL